VKAARRFVIATDPHGDERDDDTTAALRAFIADFKPEIRIHAGDNWDFRNFRQGASDDEKAHSLQEDWEMGEEWMRKFFEGGKTNHFLRGNHDERIWRLAGSSTGIMRDCANDGIKRIEGIVKRAQATMLPYDSRHGVLRLGSLKVVHGYFAGVGAARRHGITYGNVLFGHIHSTDSSPVESADGPAEARGIGCCCKIDMGYNQHMPAKLRHVNAWCYGMLFSDGSYQLFQAKKINGRFYAAESIKEF
jgi:hypothetical protein